MRRNVRKFLIPGVGLVLATSGFAYMSTNSVDRTYSGEGVGTVNGYAVYDVHVSASDITNGKVGYIHFNSIPMDNDHTTESWPVTGEVKAGGTWYSCTSAWGGTDTRTNSYTDEYMPNGGGNADGGYVQDNGSPQASWTCDVRGAAEGISPAAINNLTFMITN